MKLRSHFFIFFILLVINFAICWYIVDSNTFKLPQKVKFKSASKEEALVIKFNDASGTTKLEINMNDCNGNPVVEEFKARKNPNNLNKLKYKFKDENNKKRPVYVVKYSKKENEDDFKVFVSIKEEDLSDEDLPEKEEGKEKSKEDEKKETLVCKVKFGDGKIKIGGDEECLKAYEIKNMTERKKKKSISKLKVYNMKGEYIASVSKSSESGKIKVKKVIKDQENKEDLYSTKDINYLSYAVGVMGLESMNPKLRAVIAAELIRKGK